VLIGEIIGNLIGVDRIIAGYVAVIFVVLGHNWPAFLGFKGGKGVATSLGAMLAINPIIALSCLGIFIVVVAVSKYVSLGSVVGIAFSAPFMLISKNNPGFDFQEILSLEDKPYFL